jgi:uncharacterized protein YutE (UPF0331/DUF86 family)
MPIEIDDVMLNKAAIIERCVKRIHEEYAANPALDNYTHVDAMTLNIERACQACIDLAMHLISAHRLGMPQSSSDAFALLTQNHLIDKKLEMTMRAMTGFRNIAVHQYQTLDMEILKYIAETGWRDFQAFCRKLGLRIIDR